jgi:hypothetical protein
VHQTLQRSWLRAYGADPVQPFPGHGQQKLEAAELKRLKREVTKLKAPRSAASLGSWQPEPATLPDLEMAGPRITHCRVGFTPLRGADSTV